MPLPSHDAVLAIGRGHDVVDDPCVDEDRVGDPRVLRIADVERVQTIADRAQIGILAVRVRPELGGRQFGDGHSAERRRRAPDIAVLDNDTGLGAGCAYRSAHGVGAGLVGNEAAVGSTTPSPGATSTGGVTDDTS